MRPPGSSPASERCSDSDRELPDAHTRPRGAARSVRVRPEQLARHLGRGLASVYVVHGDEPLQREESLDAIRAAARAAGFSERIVLHAETGFDWSELEAHAASLSLFADRRLIDLRLPGGSPGRDGGPVLAQYAANPPPDMVLLLSCRRLDRRSTATKWFRALEGAGDVVEVFPVGSRDLPRWIVDRGAERGVPFERDAAVALAERSEGNLLACAQEVDKLRLLCEGRPVTVDDVMDTVADQAPGSGRSTSSTRRWKATAHERCGFCGSCARRAWSRSTSSAP